MVRNLLFLASLGLITACATTDSFNMAEFESELRGPAGTEMSPALKKKLAELDKEIPSELFGRYAVGLEDLVILQVNDVYEVEPSEAGTRGGLARLARIRSELGRIAKPVDGRTQRVLSILPGDFMSPSAIGASKELSRGPTWEKGQYVAGRHMIEGLRAAGMDIVSFGNHEFDLPSRFPVKAPNPGLPPQELINRIEEFTAPRPLNDDRGMHLHFGSLANPKWLAGNVRLNQDQKFPLPKGFEKSENPYIWKTKISIEGQAVPIRVGVISVCLHVNKNYLTFETPEGQKEYIHESTKRQLAFVENYEDPAEPGIKGVNLVIAMTHQSMAADQEFAKTYANRIHLVAGGHEHDRQSDALIRPETFPGEWRVLRVTKADANAKSAYVHKFRFTMQGGKVFPKQAWSEWVSIDSHIKDEPAVRKITKGFEQQAKKSFREEFVTETEKYRPDHVVWKTENTLDGRESKIRTQKTHLSEMIGRGLAARAYRYQKSDQSKYPKSFQNTFPTVIGAIYHGGTIRIDDRLLSESSLKEVLPPREVSLQTRACESRNNCVPMNDPRCEKKELCPGDITEYDLLRIAPFPETVMSTMVLSGKEISELYHCNNYNSGTGSYLHFTNIFQCKADNRFLCHFPPQDGAPEFTPTAQEVPLSPNAKYAVASLDYLTHVAFQPPQNPNYKKVKGPPIFPPANELVPGKKNPGWVRAHDFRRVMIEEPVANPWVNRVISEKGVEETPGYGKQPENRLPSAKAPDCVYF